MNIQYDTQNLRKSSMLKIDEHPSKESKQFNANKD